MKAILKTVLNVITVQKYSIRKDASVTQCRTQIFRNMIYVAGLKFVAELAITNIVLWDVFSYGLVRPVLQT